MKFELRFLNSFWLMIPLLVWNIVLGPKITDPRITSDANSQQWLLLMENITRMAVFILPLFVPIQLKDRMSKIGLLVYITGAAVYFASWLPLIFAPHSSWSMSAGGLLAPRLTPLLPFLGIGLIGHNWLYGAVSLIFILLHTWHGIQNL